MSPSMTFILFNSFISGNLYKAHRNLVFQVEISGGWPSWYFFVCIAQFLSRKKNTEVVVLAVRICSHKKILMYFSKKYIYQIFVFLKVSANFFLKVSAKCLINDTEPITLRKKCPNTELFLVLTFLHSDWIRRFTP